MATNQAVLPSETLSKPTKTEKRKPVFTKVDQIKPGTKNHTLTVNVVTANTVLQKGREPALNSRPTRIAECLFGDATDCIVFTAHNDQSLSKFIITW